MKKIFIIFIVLFAISVLMVACSGENGNNSEEDLSGGEYVAKAVELAVPKLSKDDYNNIFWDEIENAEGYIVNVNGTDKPVQTETFFRLLSEDGTYTIKVLAKGNGKTYLDSTYSESIEYHTEEFCAVTKTESGKWTIIGKDYVVKGAEYNFTVSLSKIYEGSFKVYVNGSEISAVNGLYTVSNVTTDLTISVDDSDLEFYSSKIEFVNNGTHVNVLGENRVIFGDDYEFQVVPSGNYVELVYFNDKLLEKRQSGKYVIENVTNDIEIVVDEYSKDFLNTFVKESLSSKVLYYDTCWNAAVGDREGLGLKGANGATFYNPFVRNLTNGVNRIIEFSSQNTYDGNELQSADIILTDVTTGKVLTVNFQSFKSMGGGSHNAWISVIIDGVTKFGDVDGYKFNFSNYIVEGEYYSQLPYFDLDTVNGKVICGDFVYQDDELKHFGTGGTRLTVKFDSTSNSRGIFITELFNQPIDPNKLMIGEFYGNVTVIDNYTLEGDGISITGTKIIGETDYTARYYSNVPLNNGDNTLLEFLTTNNDNSNVSKLQIYFYDGENTIRVRIWTAAGVSGDPSRKGAFLVGMYFNEVPINGGVDGYEETCNFQNTGVQSGVKYYRAPIITLNTATGVLSYGGISAQNDVLKGFGANGVSVKIVYEGCVTDNGLVVGTACNIDLA